MATSIPNEKPGNLICVGIPTKNGLWSHNFGISLPLLQTPINCSLMYAKVVGKPVDEARNLIVEMAKEAKAKYLLFIDDDNLIPPFTIPRLLNLKTKVASGVYYTKYQPPTPVILKKDYPGGWDKWTYGDVVDVDYIGLGCALIDMSIFDEIEQPYFKYSKGSIDPHKSEPHIGEDIYFCDKVLSKGYKIWVDTYIQVAHEDFANETLYFFYEPAHCGAWQTKGGDIQYLPDVSMRSKITQATEIFVSVPKLCWGYGPHDGFVEAGTVDVVEIRRRFKDVEHIKIRGIFEYKSPEEVVSFLHAIFSVAKVGAYIEVKVPNAIPKIRSLAGETDEVFIDKFTGPPQGRYKSYYTKGNIEAIAKLLNINEIKIVCENDDLVLTGKV
jgi:glycosyltransferase involved in cell wall biosynthesis